jgi:hypothetical protein
MPEAVAHERRCVVAPSPMVCATRGRVRFPIVGFSSRLTSGSALHPRADRSRRDLLAPLRGSDWMGTSSVGLRPRLPAFAASPLPGREKGDILLFPRPKESSTFQKSRMSPFLVPGRNRRHANRSRSAEVTSQPGVGLSPGTGRQHVAWGASPREGCPMRSPAPVRGGSGWTADSFNPRPSGPAVWRGPLAALHAQRMSPATRAVDAGGRRSLGLAPQATRCRPLRGLKTTPLREKGDILLFSRPKASSTCQKSRMSPFLARFHHATLTLG